MINFSSRRNIFLITTAVIVAYLAVFFIAQPEYFTSNSFPHGIRLIRDDYDRSVHFERASWFLNDLVPYQEVFSEYPQLITYLFAIPALFTSSVATYINIYSLIMVLIYIALIYVTLELLKIYNKSTSYIYLLLLPSFLYHTLNRFDILPALLVSLSLLFFLKNRYLLSTVVLVAGFFVKWYPILILPLLLSQLWVKNRKAFFKAIGLTSAIVGSVFAFSFWWSGWSVLDPYLWHLGKGYYYESIYHLLGIATSGLRIDDQGFIALLSLTFQIISISLPLLVFVRPKLISKEQLLDMILLVILIFVFFSSGRAPQFNLWFVPLYILAIRNRKGLWLLIIFDLVNYLFYPLGFGAASGDLSWLNNWLSLIKQVLFVYLFYYLLLPYFVIKKIKK